MTNALEALNWYEDKAREPSDETILSQRSRFGLVEKRPAALEMTDKQVLDWIGKSADQVVWSKGNDLYPGRWHIYNDELDKPVSGKTLREAVCLAAAKLREVNE